MIGTSDQSCWLAEACKILLLLTLCTSTAINTIAASVAVAKGSYDQV